MCRFGGFSFGEENRLSKLNATQLARAIDDLSTAFNNGTSVVPQQFTSDLEEFLEYAITQDNAKVGSIPVSCVDCAVVLFKHFNTFLYR